MIHVKTDDFKALKTTQQNTVKVHGKEIPYEVISEDNILQDENGVDAGTMFTFTYMRSDVTLEERKRRPVLFAFNGGPGSSCAWLHLGLLGPKIVKFEDPFHPQQHAPYKLENNDECLLEICDIVMMDPPSTGYGLLFDKQFEKDFFGLDEDAEAFAAVIEKWLISGDRMSSPKYIMGESYGTLRAPVLADALLGGPTCSNMCCRGISIDGIILEGTCIAAQPGTGEVTVRESDVEQSVLTLPSLAATRYYHQPVSGTDRNSFIKEAYDFSLNEYAQTLMLGNRSSLKQRGACLNSLSYFTGVPQTWFKRNGLRLLPSDFTELYSEILGGRIGQYDSRRLLPSAKFDFPFDPVNDDSAMGSYIPYFEGAMNSTAREILGLNTNRPYRLINFAAESAWKWQGARTPFDALDDLLRKNNTIRVFVGNGIYDLVTTVGSAMYSFSQLQHGFERIKINNYPSGHMIYADKENFTALSNDIRDFISEV